MILNSPLVSTQWLAEHLRQPSLRVFDCSIYLMPNPDGAGMIPRSGRAMWREAHIPGANFLEMLSDFSDNAKPAPVMMPAAERFTELCSAHGIGSRTAVVLYSGQSMAWSARMWWMLRTMGFDNVAVLDGGWEKWQREGRQVSVADTPYAPAPFPAKPQAGMWADQNDVLQAIHNPSVCTINALSPALYAGTEPRFPRAGHISGSHNVYANDLIDPADGTFLPREALRARFEATGALCRRTILYCGTGVSAAVDALALALLGHQDYAVYDGSMAEWSMDPALPLTLGALPG